ncbi:diguanylate cyclase [Tissierella sp.]|uniref:diguanylate cyclase n=1 Tax=Tissierella sp. TaxID=41274 RepID=UPI00285C96E0|nr:diguanylate cyclase [Tissierella sp.]MDR7857303.1 diguanylate cyclase [Tissierella sp.]
MKIIDNRYKIEKAFEQNAYFESYIISDLWEDDETKYMKIYENNISKELVNYFADNFIHLYNIRHEFILSSDKFNLVNTIDTKKTNMLLYYSLTEYTNSPQLSKIKDKLDLRQRLHIILDAMEAIDFLHFKGATYRLLNPSNIFVSEKNNIKLTDLSTIVEKTLADHYDDFERYFISPQALINKNENDNRIDYYSLGILIKYLLLQDFLVDNIKIFKYDEMLLLTEEQKLTLNNIIHKLTRRDFSTEDVKLVEIIDEISNLFNLDYYYDIRKNRDALYFNNRIISRDKEIAQVMAIDEEIINGNNKSNGLVVNGDFGMGKSRFLNEISFKLKLMGRNVYHIEVHESENNDLLDMSNILKQTMKDTPPELMEKYRNELSRLLPELRLNIEEDIETDLSQMSERFRLYNRVGNYFTELSKENIMYIIIDDIQNCNSNFLMLLDYLIKNIKSNNLFFILSYEVGRADKNFIIKNKCEEWVRETYFTDIDLHKLDLEEVGLMIRNILGMSYVPMELASVLFKEGQGNPRYIEYIIKHLYSIGDLYMNVSGTWYRKGDSYDDLYFPSDIDDALKKQITIIKENYFEVFKVMVIFNEVLYKKILLNMVDLNQKKLEEELDDLIRLRLIDEKVADRGYSYSVNNNDLKKLIYHELSQDEKIKLHSKAAKVIQEIEFENLDMMLEELLYHLDRSNQSDIALEIIISKVKSLENQYSPNARFLLERAYNIVKNSKGTTKLEILERLVDIYYLKSETEKGRAYLDEYQKEAERVKDLKHIIKAKTTIIEIYHIRMQWESVYKEIQEIEDISKANNYIEGIIVVLTLRARPAIQNRELKLSEDILLEAIRLSEQYEINDYMGTIYNRLGLTRFLNGNIEKAIENYEQSIFYHQKTGNLVEATRPINNIGTIYADYYSDIDKAMESYEKGLKIASKYGIQEVEITFLMNIASIYIDKHEFERSLQFVEAARKSAIELQDINKLVTIYILMGQNYLSISDYNKAYECYNYLKEIYKNKEIADFETNSNYQNFLGDFYSYLGSWEKGIEHSRIASELYKEFSTKEYLRAQCRILYLKYFEQSIYQVEEIDNIRNLYKETKLVQDRRSSLLQFSLVSILAEDLDYARELLSEDATLIGSWDNEYLQKLRNILIICVDPLKVDINHLIAIMESLTKKNEYLVKSFLIMKIGLMLFSKGEYKKSLKYLLEILDSIYKVILTIPDSKLKFSYIKSRKVDLVKEKIAMAIKELYNSTIINTKLEDITEEDLYDYFDITNIIEIVGSEEFVKISQLDYYDEVLDINNIESLISKLRDDYESNLNLILSYLCKESFANRGLILDYDEINKNYKVVSSLNNNSNHMVNENILNLANRSSKGLLISNNTNEAKRSRYKEFLSNEIKGIICVPVIISEEDSKVELDRRKHSFEKGYSKGYIYLETDKVFNRFDYERLELVSNLSYLVFVNLDNNKLKLMATTDKLTGTFTRKYYESRFDQLLIDMKAINGNFSVLMLDIDRFKNINDTYGHRKGDDVLAAIGNVLKSTVRSTDIVARYGGEEFTVLLKNTLEEESKIIAEKIRKNIENIKIQGIEQQITVSMGISLYPQHSQFKEDLTEKVDQALYYAKETGRNKVVLWNSQMGDTINRIDKLAGILTGNTEEDNINLSALIDVIELIKEKGNVGDKTFKFLGRLLETIDAEYATIVPLNNGIETNRYFSRTRFNDNWTKITSLNNNIIDKVIKTKKGEFLIDWDNFDNVDSLSGLPNWQSIMVLPMIKDEDIKGILYISAPLKNKEFDFNSFNLAKSLVNIFTGIL